MSKIFFNDGSTVLGDLKPMDGGYQIGTNLYLINNNDGDNLYMVDVGTGTAWVAQFIVNASSEQEAVDKVADFAEDNELCCVSEHYELQDLCDDGQTVDEYAETHNLTCCGNHGVYMELMLYQKLY